jgi:hypothetical protein
MSRFSVLLCASALSATSPVIAQTTAPNTPASPTVAQNDPDQLICRRQEPKTGSIMLAKKVCHTRDEWSKIAAASQEQMRRMQESGWGKSQ